MEDSQTDDKKVAAAPRKMSVEEVVEPNSGRALILGSAGSIRTTDIPIEPMAAKKLAPTRNSLKGLAVEQLKPLKRVFRSRGPSTQDNSEKRKNPGPKRRIKDPPVVKKTEQNTVLPVVEPNGGQALIMRGNARTTTADANPTKDQKRRNRHGNSHRPGTNFQHASNVQRLKPASIGNDNISTTTVTMANYKRRVDSKRSPQRKLVPPATLKTNQPDETTTKSKSVMTDDEIKAEIKELNWHLHRKGHAQQGHPSMIVEEEEKAEDEDSEIGSDANIRSEFESSDSSMDMQEYTDNILRLTRQHHSSRKGFTLSESMPMDSVTNPSLLGKESKSTKEFDAKGSSELMGRSYPPGSSSSLSVTLPGAFRIGLDQTGMSTRLGDRPIGGEVLIQATLVEESPEPPPPPPPPGEQSAVVAGEAVIIAEAMKSSWYTQKRFLLSIGVLALLGIGLGVWLASQEGKTQTQFVELSPSPSFSAMPSEQSSTAQPSVIPSTAPTETQTRIVTLMIEFDNFPQETGWSLSGPCGIVEQAETGKYDQATFLDGNATVEFEVYIDTTYVFTLTDSFGDGFCCDGGSVVLSVLSDGVERVLLKDADNFGAILSTTFRLPGDLATEITCAPTASPSKTSPSSVPSSRPTTTPLPSSSPTTLASTFVSLQNRDRCLQVPGSEAANGVVLSMANCTLAPNQLWVVRTDEVLIRSVLDLTFCIDSQDTETEVGALLQLYECTEDFPPQFFALTPEGALANTRSVRYICVAASAETIALAACNETDPDQMWAAMQLPRPFAPSSSPSLSAQPSSFPTTILSDSMTFENNNLCLSISTSPLTEKLYLDECSRGTEQLWRVDAQGSVHSADTYSLCWAYDGGFLYIDYCYGMGFVYTPETKRISPVYDQEMCLEPSEVGDDGLGTRLSMITLAPCNTTLSAQIWESSGPSLPTTTPSLTPSRTIPPSQSPSVSPRPTTTEMPTGSPSVATTRTLELTIFFGLYPQSISWEIWGGPCGARIDGVDRYHQGEYREATAVERRELDIGYEYTFTLYAEASDRTERRVVLKLEQADGIYTVLLRLADNFVSPQSVTFLIPFINNTFLPTQNCT